VANTYWNAPVVNQDYKNHPETPLVIGGFEDWLQVHLIPYLTNDRIIELSNARGNSNQDFVNKVKKYNDLYIIIPKNVQEIYTVPDEYIIKDEFKVGKYMLARRLKRIQ